VAEHVPVLTIDGPSGSGKGTVARELARALGWHLLDSGALYRAVALMALDVGVSLHDEAALARLAERLDLRFEDAGDDTAVYLAGRVVTTELRAETTGDAASQVAQFPAVRTALLALQRGFATPPGLIADGRDMGTVVFPAAPCKYFLTASAEARALRRHKQLNEKGISVSLAALAREIADRDLRDSSRAVAPLKAAPGARVIDSTHMSAADVVALILDELGEHGIAPVAR
jgi:cytidylate kinase